MAFQRVQTARSYVKYKECEPGQVIAEGLYVGAEDGKFGIQHVFRNEKSKSTTVLGSSGHLNWLLDSYATPGKSLCRVVYREFKALEKGPFKGKMSHSFDLDVDDGEGETSVSAAETANVAATHLETNPENEISL